MNTEPSGSAAHSKAGTMSTPEVPHVQPGNVLLVVLVGFIVVWGLVYGLWQIRWWEPALVVGWVLMGRKH